MHALHNISCLAVALGFIVIALLYGNAESAARTVRRQADAKVGEGVWRVIEVYLICDHSCYNEMKKDRLDPEQYIYSIAKDTDNRMERLKLHLVVVGIEIWNTSQLIETSLDMDEYRTNVGKYRVDQQLKRRWSDLTFLFTSLDANLQGGATAGIVSYSGLCAGRYGAGVIKYSRPDVRWMAEVVFHEIGHSLGMNHDKSGCCPQGNNNCVMSHIMNMYQVNTFVFSTCSKAEFDAFQKADNFECVYDLPKTAYVPASQDKCGNGVVDDGEECDCGNSCVFGCCNCCMKCKLNKQKDAVCYRGACCNMDNCQLRGSSDVCRETGGTCDKADVCSGNSTECPHAFEPDFTPCNDTYSQGGLCINGMCQTHNSQCQKVWNSEYRQATDGCFERALKYPSSTGNCGVINPKYGLYEKCTQENYMCSFLHCTKTTGKMELVDTNPFRKAMKNPKVNGEECIVLTHGEWEVKAAVYVHVTDGTVCGADKACWAGECMQLDTVKSNMAVIVPTQPEPIGWCGDGLITDEEECDCGSNQCECCDPITCKFISKGSPCLFTMCGTCSGDSNQCTSVAVDYTACEGGTGNCVQGKCRSRTASCKRLFNDDTAVANILMYESKAGQKSSTFNNGGYLLKNTQTRGWDVKLFESMLDNGCGILLCKTPNSGNIFDEATGRRVTSETFYYNDAKKDTRVLYYTTETIRKGPKHYQKYYPVLAEDGTACTHNGTRGYCDSKFLKMDDDNWNWFWYSRCMPLNSQ